ncbi:MAG: dethiobiotin synthase [Desulfarculus sp.]|nr:dethiobiotin synthase [Desulfarculus sp.]
MNQAKGVFITGTDTEVGKTVVSTALLMALRQKGVDAGYLKPVATGGLEEEGRLVSPDLVFVRKVAGLADPPESSNPLCLRHPLAPLVAARLEGVHISVAKVRALLRSTLERHQFTIVEGVGGVMVPLTSRLILLDLMVDLDLPVWVVARPGLGTINHTLLTIGAARDRGLKVVGFVFCGPDPELPPDPAIPYNSALITDFSGVPFLGSLPWLARSADGLVDGAQLLATTAAMDLDPVLDLVRPR